MAVLATQPWDAKFSLHYQQHQIHRRQRIKIQLKGRRRNGRRSPSNEGKVVRQIILVITQSERLQVSLLTFGMTRSDPQYQRLKPVAAKKAKHHQGCLIQIKVGPIINQSKVLNGPRQSILNILTKGKIWLAQIQSPTLRLTPRGPEVPITILIFL